MAIEAYRTQLPVLEREIAFGDGPPTTGTYKAGALVICTDTATNNPVLWKCITAGTPGTWESVGESLRQVDFNVIGGAAAADYDGCVIMRGAWQLVAGIERHQVAGNDGGAVTLMVKKVPSGTAKASGTDMLSAGVNLKGTADTNAALALHATTANLQVADGNAIALVLTGTATTCDGVSVSLWFKKL